MNRILDDELRDHLILAQRMAFTPPLTLTPPAKFVSLDDFVQTPIGEQLELFVILRGQLPEGIARRVTVRIRGDAYQLARWVTFRTKDGREFETQLEPLASADGTIGPLRIPDAFIAHLCLVI